MKILISTGIYPPKIGGPAQYAKNIKNEFEKSGHSVSVATFSSVEERLPSGIRHLYFLFKVLPKVMGSDLVIILDTFSVGAPTTLLCKILKKKSILRTGGDFLWEQYVERTGKKVLLRDFYKTELSNLNTKERMIFGVSKWVVKNVSAMVFSTTWQKDIWQNPYYLYPERTFIVENYYGEKSSDEKPINKAFIGSTRPLRWKNIDTLEIVFSGIREDYPYVDLYTDNLSFETFMEKIKNSYAVIQMSLGDISPNLILDAIRYNRPFICTKEVGIYDRIKDAGIFVDPLNQQEIKSAIVNLISEEGYNAAKQKVSHFSFTHSWSQIASEILLVGDKLK